ncbi:MAG: copper resistance protein CopC [Actinomycetota bacterium]|nr:copper resistance protein CopC [Actinomycetota bacterium]
MSRRRVTLVALLAAAGVLGWAAPASAHADLIRSSPAAGAVLAAPPAEVLLDFSEGIDLTLGSVSVVGPSGQAASGRARVRGPHHAELAVPLRPGLAKGTYTLSYRVLSDDGHPVTGGLSFSIGAPSVRPAGAPARAASGWWLREVLVDVRAVGYAGLVLLIGPALVLAGLWPRRLPAAPVRRLVWVGWCTVGVTTVVEVVLQAPYAAGTGLRAVTASQVVAVLGTRFGAAHEVRLAILLAGAPLLVRLLRPDAPDRGTRAAAATLTVGLLITWPWSGHGGTSPMPAFTLLSDSVHLAAMAIWLGGLLVLSRHLLPVVSAGELGLLLPEWSRWATLAVLALVCSGVVQAVLEVGGWRRLTGTAYGQLVLTKVSLLGVMVGLAIFARGWIRRRRHLGVEPDDRFPRSLRALRRGLLVEAAVGAAVLVVAAVLVQTPPGRSVPTGGRSSLPADRAR